MLDVGGNIDNVTRRKLSWIFAALLIPAGTADAKKNLTAFVFCVVNMLVVAAIRFKGDVCNHDLLGRKHLKIAPADKILFKNRIRLSFRKNRV